MLESGGESLIGPACARLVTLFEGISVLNDNAGLRVSFHRGLQNAAQIVAQ